MTAKKPVRAKRLARQEDRDYAAEMAKLYEDQTPVLFECDIDGNETLVKLDGHDLARLLHDFAIHGTWQTRPNFFRPLLVRHEYRRLRALSTPSGDAIQAIAEQYKVSYETVRSILHRKRKHSV